MSRGSGGYGAKFPWRSSHAMRSEQIQQLFTVPGGHANGTVTVNFDKLSLTCG